MAAALASHRRWRYVSAALATVALGLASRRWPVLGPAPGDALYASLLYWLLRAAAPHHRAGLAALGAFLLATAVELSQLWQPDWLLAVRATRLGGWVLGHAFTWADVTCYALGAGLAWGAERAVCSARAWPIPAAATTDQPKPSPPRRRGPRLPEP
jgi:hypothetical protein